LSLIVAGIVTNSDNHLRLRPGLFKSPQEIKFVIFSCEKDSFPLSALRAGCSFGPLRWNANNLVSGAKLKGGLR